MIRTNNIRFLGITLVMLFMNILGYSQTNYYVETSGDDANTGLIGFPKATVQGVINDYDLGIGDTIFVGSGTFFEENITPEWSGSDTDEGFVVKGQGQGTTIFDGTNDSGVGFNMDGNGSSDNITFMDFTIQNMENAFYYNESGGVTGHVIKNVDITSCSDNAGAGIRIFSSNSYTITVENCNFYNNSVTQNGTCIYNYSSNSTLSFTDCNFYNNTSGYSGTVMSASTIVSGNDYTFTRCKMYGNSATDGDGACIDMEDENSLTMTNCLLYENSQGNNSWDEGVVWLHGVTTATFMNCTFVDNTNSAGGIAGLYQDDGTSTVTNCIFWNNTGYDFDGGGSVNINNSIYQTENVSGSITSSSTSDPLFEDVSTDDYSLSVSSPAIDNGTNTGAPALDLLGASRSDGFNDMGAYEYGAIILPIELTSFIGVENKSNVDLEWVVASQINNDYFTLEHSLDGYKWEIITNINGVGSTTESIKYNYTHTNPKSGMNYYRLTQTDFDGKFETFSPVAVYVKGEKRYVVSRYNLLGQPVNEDYQGVMILLWDNGEKDLILKSE